MYQIEKYIDFSMTVNGITLPLGPGDVRGINIIQNVNNTIPVIQGTISDNQGWQAKHNLLRDGAIIKTAFGPGGRQYPGTEFSLMNQPNGPTAGQSQTIKFSGILNQPKFFRGTMNEAVSQKTSAEAIKEIAGKLGIKVETDSTNDKMTWLPLNKSFMQTMRRIADHGFSNSSSAMQLAMGLLGTGAHVLLYKDLSRAIKQSSVATLTSEKFAKGSDISVQLANVRSHSGTLNYFGGYGGNISQVNLDGVTDIFSKIPIEKILGILNMSTRIKDLVGELPRIFLPRETGNTHARYGKAQIQNERIKQTFSSYATVYTRDYTNLKVLDPVDLNIASGDEPNLTANGRYLVHSRTQHVTGLHYAEMLVLYRPGTNNKTSHGEGQV